MVDFSQPILVVDDLKTMTNIVESLLRKCGFTNIEQVNDPNAALQKIQANHYLLVVSDGEMPDMNGLDLLRQVRAGPKFAQVPFIIMSANTGPRYAEAAMTAGANAFLTKPFSATTLRDVIVQIFRALES
jgi:two-component system chemotaxis response regulator CheY